MQTPTQLPKRADGRTDWQAFFAAATPGDSFVLSARIQRGISSAARINAIATRQRDNHDGTFTLEILHSYAHERTRMLADFARINHSQLKAIHQAGEKSGLFA